MNASDDKAVDDGGKVVDVVKKEMRKLRYQCREVRQYETMIFLFLFAFLFTSALRILENEIHVCFHLLYLASLLNTPYRL